MKLLPVKLESFENVALVQNLLIGDQDQYYKAIKKHLKELSVPWISRHLKVEKALATLYFFHQ